MLPKPEQKSTKVWPKHPAGTHQLALADVIYLGRRVSEWKGVRRAQERVALIWQSQEFEPGTPQRFELASEFTYSVYETAALRAFLNRWIGPFDNEAAAEAALVSLDKRIGDNVTGTITHEKSKDGTKTYVNVDAVSPPMKGMTSFPVVGYERRLYWTDKTAKYATDYAMFLAEQKKEASAQAQRTDEFSETAGDAWEDGTPI